MTAGADPFVVKGTVDSMRVPSEGAPAGEHLV